MSTRSKIKVSGSKAWPVCRADNFTAKAIAKELANISAYGIQYVNDVIVHIVFKV
jgi:hypothetical protein